MCARQRLFYSLLAAAYSPDRVLAALRSPREPSSLSIDLGQQGAYSGLPSASWPGDLQQPAGYDFLQPGAYELQQQWGYGAQAPADAVPPCEPSPCEPAGGAYAPAGYDQGGAYAPYAGGPYAAAAPWPVATPSPYVVPCVPCTAPCVPCPTTTTTTTTATTTTTTEEVVNTTIPPCEPMNTTEEPNCLSCARGFASEGGCALVGVGAQIPLYLTGTCKTCAAAIVDYCTVAAPGHPTTTTSTTAPDCTQCSKAFDNDGGCEKVMNGSTQAQVAQFIPFGCDPCAEEIMSFCSTATIAQPNTTAAVAASTTSAPVAVVGPLVNETNETANMSFFMETTETPGWALDAVESQSQACAGCSASFERSGGCNAIMRGAEHYSFVPPGCGMCGHEVVPYCVSRLVADSAETAVKQEMAKLAVDKVQQEEVDRASFSNAREASPSVRGSTSSAARGGSDNGQSEGDCQGFGCVLDWFRNSIRRARSGEDTADAAAQNQ